jgi:hypothetical protein
MSGTPTLDALINAIRVRQHERSAEGFPPMDEMHIPAAAFDRLQQEGKTITAIMAAGEGSSPMTINGVVILRLPHG